MLLLSTVLFSLSQTLVLPALPAIGEELGATPLATSWVLTGFLLSASVTTPVVGRLGDRYDKGSVLVAVLLVFSVGAVVSALATSIGVLVAGRVLMGVAGGVFPLSFGIARDALPPARVPGALSALSAVLGVGAGIGLPLSGVVVDRLDISWLFWTALLALPTALLVRRWVPASPPGAGGGVDWPGAALLAAALTGLLLAVTQGGTWGWTSPTTLGSAAGGLVVGAAWVWWEARAASPLVDLGTLRRRPVLAADLAAVIIGFGLFAGFLLVPQLAQAAPPVGLGSTATVAGLLLLPSAVAQLAVAPVAARLGTRFGFRTTLLLGAALVAASFGGLALAHEAAWQLAANATLLGVGVSFSFASLANIVVDAVGPQEVGVATGLNTVARTVGGSFGSAVATVVLNATADADGALTDAGFTAAFGVAAAAALVATATALLVPRRPA